MRQARDDRDWLAAWFEYPLTDSEESIRAPDGLQGRPRSAIRLAPLPPGCVQRTVTTEDAER